MLGSYLSTKPSSYHTQAIYSENSFSGIGTLSKLLKQLGERSMIFLNLLGLDCNSPHTKETSCRVTNFGPLYSPTSTKKKDILFITGNRNAIVRSQEVTGVTGKFGFGIQNEAGQGTTEFCQENSLI